MPCVFIHMHTHLRRCLPPKLLLLFMSHYCREEYFRMKQQWQTLSETQVKHFTSYRECSSLISESGVCSGVILVE